MQSCFGSILETLETLCNLTSHDLLAVGENLTVVAKVIAVLNLTTGKTVIVFLMLIIVSLAFMYWSYFLYRSSRVQ